MEKVKLEKVCNAASLSEEEYALVRKDYFGASDASVLCEVNLYKKLPALILEKNTKFVTAEEKEIGKKPAVKKGKDLEDLILNKFISETGIAVEKPDDMFKIKEYPFLTINFDGLTPELIPVECKLVTRFGEKYYNKLTPNRTKFIPTRQGDCAEHIKYWAAKVGIPAYYYTQVQQQMLGANAEFAYLAVLFDESWDFVYYIVPRDDITISHIVSRGLKASNKLIPNEKTE